MLSIDPFIYTLGLLYFMQQLIKWCGLLGLRGK